jgi:hypothetical protein
LYLTQVIRLFQVMKPMLALRPLKIMDLVEDQLSFSKKLMKKVMMLSNMVNKLELSQINIFFINLFIFIQLSVLLKHSQDFQGSKKFV